MKLIKVVAYARFSSTKQREESIKPLNRKNKSTPRTLGIPLILC